MKDKKSITAFVLIFIIAFAYPYILQKFFPHLVPGKAQEQPAQNEVQESPLPAEESPISDAKRESPAAGPSEEKEPGPVIALFEEKSYVFEDDDAKLTFSNRGGGLREANFKTYLTDIALDSAEDYALNVLSIGKFSGIENLEFSVVEQTPGRIVMESVLEHAGIKVQKTFQKTDLKYFYTVRLRITNLGEEKFFMERGPVIVAGTVVLGKKKKSSYASEEATALRIDDMIERISRKDIKGSVWSDSRYLWAGLQDQTVCFILKDAEKWIEGWNVTKRLEAEKTVVKGKEEMVESEVVSSLAKLRPADIKPGEAAEYSLLFYAGPKLYYHMAKVGHEFKKIVDFGKLLAPISRALVWGLNTLYGFFHSYGICIIIITIIVKILLFPLTHSSMKSMKRMKDLQPHMEVIREQYKNDMQKMNQEMMGLYRKHKVNPVGGCFPMLLQLPIFFALFKTFSNAVEFKGASFLWIRDLASPDTVFTLGSIPINILPILMGITQFISQKQSVTDPRQAQMMYFMTIFFMFIFYSMPSGLVLYWLVSNILSIVQQEVINRKSGS